MGSSSGVEVTAWVKISDSATIDYHVFEDGLVEFSVGGCEGFDLATTEGGLRILVARAQEALEKVQSCRSCPHGGAAEPR
ncbi:MAG: hypothetical protein ACRDSH_02660 [Pseudonocardiaceae bacterium]